MFGQYGQNSQGLITELTIFLAHQYSWITGLLSPGLPSFLTHPSSWFTYLPGFSSLPYLSILPGLFIWFTFLPSSLVFWLTNLPGSPVSWLTNLPGSPVFLATQSPESWLN